MNEAVTLLCMPDHRNIVPILDVFESARTLYLVTDYADANTLTEVVQYRGMLCEADVATIVSGLLRALVHMQHSQLVHRLICPDNILLLPHHDNIAVPVLHNFEYAVSNADLKDSTSMSKCYSEHGPLSLSQLAYIAPEVARGDVGDSQQDVWSVGILMHFLLVGCTPFDDNLSSLDNLTRTIASTRGKPTFSGALWGGVTSGAKDLCASLLHSNAKYRVSASDALLHPWLNLYNSIASHSLLSMCNTFFIIHIPVCRVLLLYILPSFLAELSSFPLDIPFTLLTFVQLFPTSYKS
ncbi:serine:threonine protein kinase Chk2 [Gracilaria domingensis]|nr:serine:threonine protein kinase Chk2 [Gracilaria domingensis]